MIPRLTPARPDLAAKYLEGKVKAARFVTGEEFDVRDAIAPLREAPSADAMLSTQALKGERVTIYDRNGEGFAWGQLNSDGYVGWIPDAALIKPAAAPTRKVTALRTFAFPGPSIKLPPVETLPMGARVTVAREDGAFAVTGEGWYLPRRHLGSLDGDGKGFHRGRRTLRRHALSVGRQEFARHRLLRARPGLAERRRHRLPARQRHAAG
jgi:hypothetical protein